MVARDIVAISALVHRAMVPVIRHTINLHAVEVMQRVTGKSIPSLNLLKIVSVQQKLSQSHLCIVVYTKS